MNLEHHYALEVEWTGNLGRGTSDYRSYSREHIVRAPGKHDLEGSSDRPFHGDPSRWNPEQLLLAALSQCHMLSYLHVATVRGVVVESYLDAATGTLAQTSDGGGRFTSVTLRPAVTISAGDPALALELHNEAAAKCFIASSVAFPVEHEATVDYRQP